MLHAILTFATCDAVRLAEQKTFDDLVGGKDRIYAFIGIYSIKRAKRLLLIVESGFHMRLFVTGRQNRAR